MTMKKRRQRKTQKALAVLATVTVFASLCLLVNQISPSDTPLRIRESQLLYPEPRSQLQVGPLSAPSEAPAQESRRRISFRRTRKSYSPIPDERRVLLHPSKRQPPLEVQKWTEILKKRRKLLTLWNGSIPLSDPKHPARFPNYLKNLPPQEWKKKDKPWMNLTHYPWPDEKACGDLTVKFSSPHSLPVRGLASFPSSGNSWFRYLIDSSTGIFTGSMYNDTSLQRAGMYGEMIRWDSGMTLLQKTHGFTSGAYKPMTYDQQVEASHVYTLQRTGILLIRNPYDAIISHRHLDYSGHTGHAPPSQFTGKNWDKFVEVKTESWLAFNSIWIEHTKTRGLLVVYYDLLKRQPVEVISNVLRFFEPEVLPSNLPQRLRCLQSHLDGKMIRRSRLPKKAMQNPYSHKQMSMIRDALDQLNNVLRLNGFPEIPPELYVYPT